MLRLAFDFIITWRETRTRPNAYAIFMVTYCRQGISVGVLPLWVWWAQCGTLTSDYQPFRGLYRYFHTGTY